MNARCRDSPPGPEPPDGGSTSVTITKAFAAGAPPTVTRPPIEAVRGRLSRCGVCAPAHKTDWLNATRSNIDRAEMKLSGRRFIWRLLLVAERWLRSARL